MKQFLILTAAALALSGCSAAKIAGKTAALPFKGAYKTGEVAAKGVYYTGKGIYKTGEFVGTGAYKTARVPVTVLNGALDTSAKVLTVTTQAVDLTGKVVSISRQIPRSEAEAYISQAQGAANVLSIVVDSARGAAGR